MAYEIPEYADIRTNLLADARNRFDGLDTSEDTVIFRLLSVVAGGLWMLSWGLKYVENQIFPTTCDTDHLERWAGLYELTRTAAVQADDGTIRLFGDEGTVVSAGLQLVHDDGVTYTTTSGGTIGALEEIDVSAEADEGGLAGNKAVNVELTIQATPPGLIAVARIVDAFTNGADEESDQALRSRTLNRIRLGNAGGTANDFEQWALSIGGVIEAHCLPLRRGDGTVSVAVFADDGDGNRDEPGTTLRATVLAYLETVRPVCADVDVPVLSSLSVDCDVHDIIYEDGYDEDDVSADLEAAFRETVRAVAPGDTLYRVQLLRALGSVTGVASFTLLVPDDDVPSTVDATTVEYLLPGDFDITSSEMT